MKIRSKLSWTFIVLIVAGITTVSSYSIYFIRDYLLQQGLVELQKDIRQLAVSISDIRSDTDFQSNLKEIAKSVSYQIAFYDSTGELIYHQPEKYRPDIYINGSLQIILRGRKGLPTIVENGNNKKLISSIYLPTSVNKVSFIKLSQFKENIYHPIQKIRWIIYYGMFISIGLVFLVSIWISRYLTKPITQIKDSAQAIAEGEVEQKIDLNRRDEFGDLAVSLNRMADKLRWDTEQIKEYANRQQQFFSDITHEVRNPLHTISASLEMLAMDGLSNNNREKYLKNAQNQVQRLARLFKDLKLLQRYDADEYFIEPRSFDFSMIGQHMHEWYAENATQKGLNLDISTHQCQAYGDPGKIEQVVDNLISNAIKYTSEGTVSLKYAKEGDHIYVEIKDTGIGISDEHLDLLFDRFYRTDKARSRDKGGTGLGLSVVKSILKAHGTDIQVESEPGKGTAFRFNLKEG